MSSISKKHFVLTIDYEVFLGSDTGDIRNVLIEPTYKLMSILDINNSKMTVFWDVLHYYSICNWSKQFPLLNEEKKLIEQQIIDLVTHGHDVQLHIHPHWLDAKYENGKWLFDYSHFSIHKLSGSNDINDVYSVIGCLHKAKQIMEQIICPIKPDYRVKAYRAGGYLLEPFEDLVPAFNELGIIIDSSVCPGAKSECIPYPFDYRGYPNKPSYLFSMSPKYPNPKGSFWEYPISIIRLSPWFRFKRFVAKKMQQNEPSFSLGGLGVDFPHKRKTRLELLISLFQSTTVQLTTDGGDESLYKFAIAEAPDDSVMILHPKMQTQNSFRYLEQLLKDNYVSFTSI